MQFGAAADSAGTKTAPETVQRVIYGQYRNAWHSPVLSGGGVSGMAGLAYQVEAGSSVVRVGDGRAVYAVWDATQVATTADTGNATDIIWVNRDGVVGCSRENAVPSEPYTTLDRRVLPGKATATSASYSTWQKNYAIAYGASMGTIGEWEDPATEGMHAADDWTRTVQFTLPRDMHIQVELISTFATKLKQGNENAIGSASILWYLNLDGKSPLIWEQGIDRRYMTGQYFFDETCTQGDHTFTIRRKKGWWSDSVQDVVHAGVTPDGRHIPTIYRVREYGQAM